MAKAGVSVTLSATPNGEIELDVVAPQQPQSHPQIPQVSPEQQPQQPQSQPQKVLQVKGEVSGAKRASTIRNKSKAPKGAADTIKAKAVNIFAKKSYTSDSILYIFNLVLMLALLIPFLP